jgi:hypothetical protein
MANGLVDLIKTTIVVASLAFSVSCGGSYDNDSGNSSYGSVSQLQDFHGDVPGAIVSTDVQDQLPVVVPRQEGSYSFLPSSPTIRPKQSMYDSFIEALNEGVSRSGFWYRP